MVPVKILVGLKRKVNKRNILDICDLKKNETNLSLKNM